MLNFLSLPFPRDSSFKKQLSNALVGGLIVAIFLRVFSPFGFSAAPVSNLNLFAVGYGLITAFVIIIFALLEKFYPEPFSEERWTVGKNILMYVAIIFCIGTLNLFYTVIIAGMPLTFISFLNFQFFTLSVTFVVVSAFTMLKYFRSLDLNKKEAEKIENEIQQMQPSSSEMIINLKSDNEKDSVQLFLNDLFFIESADNYCRVYYRREKKIISVMLRSTLKRFEDQLKYPEVFRCHRTYVVNLRNVHKVSGNSQGYRLHFKDFDQTVPVSRKIGDDIHERLQKSIVQV